MGKTQFCRICRTEKNLKYTIKELRQLNKKQLLLAQATQQGQANNRASKKLLLTTPTLGNICQLCDERIQIFHRLDDRDHENNSDDEIDVGSNVNEPLPITFRDTLHSGDSVQRTTQRPESPVIVDDDDMLFNIFMQKFDQKTQIPREQITSSFSQQQIEKQLTTQFHSTYTPPQSTSGSSEGDESKVIEVLPSRENTPISMQSLPAITPNTNVVDSKGHRIVAIIELDDGDDNDQEQINSIEKHNDDCPSERNPAKDLSLVDNSSVLLLPIGNGNLNRPCIDEISKSNLVEDDEEIIFFKVDNEKQNLSASKKRKRKSYDEKELRLVASLSLVSSDSETEDSHSKVQENKVQTISVSEPTTLNVETHFTCNICDVKFPDSESLSVHDRIHQGVLKCTLCTIGFQHVKRLIHHMRFKHREYNGNALSEKPRSGQDSCMTIRLRYMQRETFYECQLCGRIDDVFREHKEHIIEKHPNESKSLRDPIMKQLKCPVCKAKCGAQYLSLGRHIISSHEYQEYKSHLRELVHVSAFGWNASRQKEVTKCAKIFQFVKRKTLFFQCKICCKVVAGYLNHLRHVNEHANTESNEKKSTTALKETVSCSITSPLGTCYLEKLRKSLKKDRVCLSNTLRKEDSLCKTLVNHNNLRNKRKQNEKVITISNKMKKPNVNDVQQPKFKTFKTEKVKKSIGNIESKNCEAAAKNESSKKLQLRKKCKPKDKEVVKLQKSVKLTKGKSKKEINKKNNKNFKEKSTKLKHIELKAQVKKIKVKPPIRQIDQQKYNCKYCLKKFKGFCVYNLHLLKDHKQNEYSKCNKCNKLYASSSDFQDHVKECTSKQKRKFSQQSLLLGNLTETYQPCVKKVPTVSSGILEYNHLWLTELQKIEKPLNINDSNLSLNESPKTALFCSQCCYCLHLFANDDDLKEHKENDHQNSIILLSCLKYHLKTKHFHLKAEL